MIHWQELEDSFMKWYYQVLPALGDNRNLALGWRMMPSEFQGIGLPNMTLEKLAASIKYLQCH
jgi:hypothetical protein